MTETERKDWREYRSTKDVGVRNRLVERHLALVHHFARRMEPQSAGALERADLVGAGVVGLMDAVAAFDPDRGYRFSTFAGTRIRGAMLDEIRRRDVAPRSVRRKQRQLEDARDRLAVELDRTPRHPELAQVLGVDSQTLWRWRWDVDRSRRVSLTDMGSSGGAPGSSGSWPVPDVEERLVREQAVARLRGELARLPERERTILEMYDLEGGCTLKDVARRLGVSESRISQLRSRALARLRERLEGLPAAA